MTAMSTIQNLRVSIARLPWPVWLLIIALLWLMVAGVLWWRVVYSDPKHVFEGMLKQNFSTVGYTREVTTMQQGLESTEIAQLQTGQQTLVRTLTVLKQQNDQVVTDAISTPENEYVRYTKIDTSRKDESGKAYDFSSAVNVWAKQESEGSNQAVSQMLLGLFPIGNVPANERKELLKFMDENPVFVANYEKVKKETNNGRPTYVYEVQLLPQTYIDMLKRYGTAIGLDDQVKDLNPADYAGSAPTTLSVRVDVLSRQLRTVTFGGTTNGSESARNEWFSGYGIRQDVELPTETITTSELQQRLSIE